MLENFDELKKDIIVYEENEVNVIKEQKFDEGYQQGLKDGYNQGREEALTEHEVLIHNILMKMEKKIEDIFESQSQHYEELEYNVKTLFFAFSQKILPRYISKYGICEMEGFLQNLFKVLIKKDKITIYLAPSMKDVLKTQMLSNGMNIDKVIFDEDKNLEKEQINAVWDDGGAKFELNTIYGLSNTILDEDIASKTDVQSTFQETIEEI